MNVIKLYFSPNKGFGFSGVLNSEVRKTLRFTLRLRNIIVISWGILRKEHN